MQKILEDTINIIKKAGKEILKIYNQDYNTYIKEDKSFVTDADLIAQDIIVDGLKKYNYPFLIEEEQDNLSRLNKKRVWIIDPLDGTNDFIDKTGEFAVMIALSENKKIILGVIYNPVQNKLYYAQKNKGTYLIEKNKKPIKLNVSNLSKLSQAIFLVSRSHSSKKVKDFLIQHKIKCSIPMGSIGVKIGLITENKADAYISFSDKTCQWDTAAPSIILEEAGGKITDIKGKKFIYNRKELRNLNGIIATNKNLYLLILKKLSKKS